MSEKRNNKIKKAKILRNSLLAYKMYLPKKNVAIKNKRADNLSNTQYVNNSLMNSNQISLCDYTLSTTERTRNNSSSENFFEKKLKNQKQAFDNNFLYNLIFQNVNRKQYKEYIYYNQLRYNKSYGNLIKNLINNGTQRKYCNLDYLTELKQLEDLIARYSIIIFFLVRNKHGQKFIFINDKGKPNIFSIFL